jgi:AraC-like DNA-binding protein
MIPADADPSAIVTFSTGDFATGDRVASLRDMIGRRFLRIDIEPLPDRPFHVEAALRTLPGLHMLSTYTLGLRMQRTKELTTDGNDCLYLAVMSAGVGIIRRGDQEITLEHGDATLLSATEPLSILCPAMSRSVLISVPATVLALLVADIGNAIMRPIPRGTGALKLLAAYVGFLKHELTLESPELKRQAASHIHDLVALAVGPTSETAETAQDHGVRAARLRAIKSDTVENLSRPDLSIATAAARHGVTPRYVRKLFESEGTTFSEFVLSQRLARAHRLLTEPRLSEQPISAIAFECGFGDLSYFNRSFRKVYNASPSDIRAPIKVDCE